MPENASGVAVEIDGRLQTVDLFDKPSTLHTLWPRLVRSYLLPALYPGVSQGQKTDVKEFLERILNSQGEAYEPVGVGTTIRLTTAEAVGAALVCEGQLVHLAVFATGEGEQRPDAPPAPRAESNPGEGDSEQVERARPWWRFWA